MAIRQCPACLTTAPMGEVASHSDDIVCAGCGQHLEVAEASRLLASTVGVAAAYAALRFVPHPHSTLGWAAPALFALLAYGCVSALALMFAADLVLQPPQAPLAVETERGHGAARH